MVIAVDQVTWHYRGTSHWMGRTPEGYDVRQDVRTGRIERIYSTNQRGQAVKLAVEIGYPEASRRMGIPAGSIKSWNARGDY